MSYEKRKLLHGLVIRISEDTGEQIGAHVEWIERMVDSETGEVESTKMLPPEPLELGADALTPLIGVVVRVQQAELEALRAEVEQLRETLGIAENGVVELTATIAALKTQTLIPEA